MLEPARLHPADVEAIARRSAELVLAALEQAPAGRAELPIGSSGAQMVDATAIAQVFDVDRDWVYAHADELGVMRLGTGSRPRLRFDPQKVAEALSRRPEGKASSTPEALADTPVTRHRRRRTTSTGRPLLPIRGEAV